MTRFASITADLLARKGEARPWNGVGPDLAKQPLAWEAPAKPVRRAGEAKLRKVSLRISPHDYERLGILAVKQGKTRQRLLQEAVSRLFTGMTEDYGVSCRCLGMPE
jgi:predicted DNA-binding protein